MWNEIQKVKNSSFVLCQTGRLGHYQSGDALIEEIKKESKWDIVGVPNNPMWKHPLRNLDIMNEIRKTNFLDAGITDQKYNFCDSKSNLSKEITKVWVLVGQHKYFKNAKKSHTCEEGTGAHLRISFWHFLMNLKNK